MFGLLKSVVATKGKRDRFPSLTGLGYEVAGRGHPRRGIGPGSLILIIHASGGEPTRAIFLAHMVPMKRVGTAEEIATHGPSSGSMSVRLSSYYVTSASLMIGGR